MKTRYVDVSEARHLNGGAAVVVDVMRAFTTAAWAFHRGAAHIALFEELDDALAYKTTNHGALAFCDGAPKDGFDLCNSPAQLRDLDVAGRAIAQRTTAGTQGAVAAQRCSPLLCTGFVTASATARHLAELDVTEVDFVVTGGDEDLACAEHIASLLGGDEPGCRYLDRARRAPAAADLLEGVRRGYQGVDAEDVGLCLELDRFDFALRADVVGGHLVLRPTTPARDE